jgi:hypothetical protein
VSLELTHMRLEKSPGKSGSFPMKLSIQDLFFSSSRS